MLQVWNRNTHSGIVGAFNVQGSSWDRRKRQFHMHNHTPPILSTLITPADVPDWEPLAPTSHMLVRQPSGSPGLRCACGLSPENVVVSDCQAGKHRSPE